MTSFFTPDDVAARRRSLAAQQPPTHEEIQAYSLQKAREELDQVLAAVRESYSTGGRGHSFSYDKTPFAGSRSKVDPRYDCEVMIAELVRLVQERTGLTCTLDPDNGPNKCGFMVTY